ncbi:hypothetical protein Y032_0276g1076 [Ancylostoma ceylanicum]|uniref:Uncharacterized protein n=1 Tax=Ancylostoma ceylanicum TaxID=53326 RepID=A0A016S8L1_9BILA|nr:hypothetical protein Y032_0276g1076 [Ancylostoma ceylanicum]
MSCVEVDASIHNATQIEGREIFPSREFPWFRRLGCGANKLRFDFHSTETTRKLREVIVRRIEFYALNIARRVKHMLANPVRSIQDPFGLGLA